MANKYVILIFSIFLFLILLGVNNFRYKNRKKLEEYLLEHGVECDGEATYIGFGRGPIFKISFKLNGKVINKILGPMDLNIINCSSKEPGKKVPVSVLVDPLNTNKYFVKQ